MVSTPAVRARCHRLPVNSRRQAVEVRTEDEFQADDSGPRVVYPSPAPHGRRRPAEVPLKT